MSHTEALVLIEGWAADGAAILAATESTADYTEATLSDLDRLLRDRPPLSEDDIVNLGSYLGAVVCRSCGASWTPVGRTPSGSDALEITMPNGSKFWPVLQIVKRLDATVSDVPSLVSFLASLRAIDAGTAQRSDERAL